MPNRDVSPAHPRESARYLAVHEPQRCRATITLRPAANPIHPNCSDRGHPRPGAGRRPGVLSDGPWSQRFLLELGNRLPLTQRGRQRPGQVARTQPARSERPSTGRPNRRRHARFDRSARPAISERSGARCGRGALRADIGRRTQTRRRRLGSLSVATRVSSRGDGTLDSQSDSARCRTLSYAFRARRLLRRSRRGARTGPDRGEAGIQTPNPRRSIGRTRIGGLDRSPSPRLHRVGCRTHPTWRRCATAPAACARSCSVS